MVGFDSCWYWFGLELKGLGMHVWGGEGRCGIRGRGWMKGDDIIWLGASFFLWCYMFVDGRWIDGQQTR